MDRRVWHIGFVDLKIGEWIVFELMSRKFSWARVRLSRTTLLLESLLLTRQCGRRRRTTGQETLLAAIPLV